MAATVEDAARFLRSELADREWHRSSDVKAAAARLGITSKLLWQAQTYVRVWVENTSTFPRRTIWKLGLRGSRDPDDLTRAELLEEVERAIRDYFEHNGS